MRQLRHEGCGARHGIYGMLYTMAVVIIFLTLSLNQFLRRSR